MSKALLDLTNAYLAIEDLLKSRILSAETRQALEQALKVLDEEAEREVKTANQAKSKGSSAA